MKIFKKNQKPILFFLKIHSLVSTKIPQSQKIRKNTIAAMIKISKFIIYQKSEGEFSVIFENFGILFSKSEKIEGAFSLKRSIVS